MTDFIGMLHSKHNIVVLELNTDPYSQIQIFIKLAIRFTLWCGVGIYLSTTNEVMAMLEM